MINVNCGITVDVLGAMRLKKIIPKITPIDIPTPCPKYHPEAEGDSAQMMKIDEVNPTAIEATAIKIDGALKPKLFNIGSRVAFQDAISVIRNTAETPYQGLIKKYALKTKVITAPIIDTAPRYNG